MRSVFPILPCPELPVTMLWQVLCTHRDSDGDPVSIRLFVLADDRDDALHRVASEIVAERNGNPGQDVEVRATVVSLENLVPAMEHDRQRLYSQDLLPITEALEMDGRQYRLAVCLVSVE